MPSIELNGARIYFEDHGQGEETIVFAHGLLWSGQMFAKQIEALQAHYRCITFDFRGQGQSEVTATGYDLDTLMADAAALIEALDVAPCHFAGLSMGGFVGLRLAARRPELIKSLILMETSADAEPEENLGRYKLLNFIARWFGIGVVASRIMPIMFGQTFLNDPQRAAERDVWRKHLINNDRIGITRAVKGTIWRESVFDEISKIDKPTLIIVGEEDVATVPEKSRRIQSQIAGSKLVIIPRAGHTSTVEEPEAVNQAIKEFLQTVS
ncbi:MAG: alpha/beta fold hydrolase [Anaerolineales bacterium]|nr:alpha/beta fold hydrolase [Anaerolineales bacterium]